MQLQLFKLDGRLDPPPDDPRFQRIVDQAKGMITRYCPEWTDHNVSDPGVALIELFAWMTETLLYRVNQVPDRMYMRFLELLGMRLEPPRAAHAPVTFYLAAPQAVDVTIKAGTEVATLRTETIEPVVFTTKTNLVIRPPRIARQYAYTQSQQDGRPVWRGYDLRQLEAGRPIMLFAEPPVPGDAFYLPLECDHSQHVLALILACKEARPKRLKPDRPPRVWEVSTGQGTWVECVVEQDRTRGFTEADGEIVLRVPDMAPAEYQGQQACWLRCRYSNPEPDNEYGRAPVIEALRIEVRGGTAPACHEAIVEDELLGHSDGSAGQQFTLRHTPVLARDPDHEYLATIAPDGAEERWQEVSDFGDSCDDRHYTLDSTSGTLTLAPSLLQPDGTVYRLGQTPPKGSRLMFKRYRYGGGLVSVPAGALTILKTSNPYVRQVINWNRAEGGRDAQRLEDAVLRSVPTYLRTRERAVTADDYEYLACQVEGVGRAQCLAPGAQPGSPGEPRPGQVVLSILPARDQGLAMPGPEDIEKLALSDELRQAVEAFLKQRQLLGAQLSVQPPVYVQVTVSARLRMARESPPRAVLDVRREAEAALYRYINPFTGGPQASGWRFGRELYRRELAALLEWLPDVESADEVSIQSEVVGGAGSASTAGGGIVRLPPNGLIISGRHQVDVERER
jgi:predicted phage baseplate assembly protein